MKVCRAEKHNQIKCFHKIMAAAFEQVIRGHLYSVGFVGTVVAKVEESKYIPSAVTMPERQVMCLNTCTLLSIRSWLEEHGGQQSNP